MAVIFAGRIARPKGYDGTMILADIPKGDPVLCAGTVVAVGFSEQFSTNYTIQTWENKKNLTLVKFEEIDSDEKVSELREKGVFVDRDLIIFPDEKTYLPEELDGCEVYDCESGKKLGEICDVWYLPANDVWVVTDGEKEFPVPVVDEIVRKTDIEKRRIEINLIPGLTELSNED